MKTRLSELIVAVLGELVLLMSAGAVVGEFVLLVSAGAVVGKLVLLMSADAQSLPPKAKITGQRIPNQ